MPSTATQTQLTSWAATLTHASAWITSAQSKQIKSLATIINGTTAPGVVATITSWAETVQNYAAVFTGAKFTTLYAVVEQMHAAVGAPNSIDVNVLALVAAGFTPVKAYAIAAIIDQSSVSVAIDSEQARANAAYLPIPAGSAAIGKIVEVAGVSPLLLEFADPPAQVVDSGGTLATTGVTVSELADRVVLTYPASTADAPDILLGPTTVLGPSTLFGS